jgi:hypothetical protein
LQEHAAAVRFDFNGANRVMSEKYAAEDSSPCSCEQVEFSESFR